MRHTAKRGESSEKNEKGRRFQSSFLMVFCRPCHEPTAWNTNRSKWCSATKTIHHIVRIGYYPVLWCSNYLQSFTPYSSLTLSTICAKRLKIVASLQTQFAQKIANDLCDNCRSLRKLRKSYASAGIRSEKKSIDLVSNPINSSHLYAHC
jgi:hypothetical protein